MLSRRRRGALRGVKGCTGKVPLTRTGSRKPGPAHVTNTKHSVFGDRPKVGDSTIGSRGTHNSYLGELGAMEVPCWKTSRIGFSHTFSARCRLALVPAGNTCCEKTGFVPRVATTPNVRILVEARGFQPKQCCWRTMFAEIQRLPTDNRQI